MSIVQKALDDLKALEDRFHNLLDPEKSIGDATRALVKSLADEVVKLRADLQAHVASAPAAADVPSAAEPAAAEPAAEATPAAE